MTQLKIHQKFTNGKNIKDTPRLPVFSTHSVVNFDFKSLNGATFKIFLQTDSSNEIILYHHPIKLVTSLLGKRTGLCVDSDPAEDRDLIRMTTDVVNDLAKTQSFLKIPNVNTKKL